MAFKRNTVDFFIYLLIYLLRLALNTENKNVCQQVTHKGTGECFQYNNTASYLYVKITNGESHIKMSRKASTMNGILGDKYIDRYAAC